MEGRHHLFFWESGGPVGQVYRPPFPKWAPFRGILPWGLWEAGVSSPGAQGSQCRNPWSPGGAERHVGPLTS